ncbi:integrase catalytic domain-containing protein [Trichonephila clavipes]|nr:integrase catalytic domain-containing protein [Trichonephila clavipes]
MMGDLPRDRIVPSRPFEKVGLGYAGPIITKLNLKRSRVTLKSYIAIFICFSTKATHLEVISDLITEAFLACLRRFIARRSKPSVIWSDNATNFKGARNILNEWNEICKSNRIQLFSAAEGIEWNFIPPASPHFGGLWEANIVHETHFIEGSEISYHELRRVNYVDGTNRSSSEFTSLVSTFFGPQ